jgi:murein DD-endopeptidase MepM/ murein hydrolase activator NlpD
VAAAGTTDPGRGAGTDPPEDGDEPRQPERDDAAVERPPTGALPAPEVTSARRRAARALLKQRERDREMGLTRAHEVSPRSPRAPRATSASRPSLSGPDLRPIPRAPISTRRRDGGPAAPRPGAGVSYPMPGEVDDIPDLSATPTPPTGAPRPAGLPGSLLGRGPVTLDPALLRPPPVHLSPRMTAIFGGLIGLAAVSAVFALLIQQKPPPNERAIAAGSASAAETEPDAARRAPEAAAKKVERKRALVPGPWRLAELEKEAGVAVERGQMEKKSLLEALGEKGVPKAEVYRIIKALDGVRKFDKTKKKDRFAVAFDRASKKVKAFEFQTSPSDIWQARADDNGVLTGAKLDMKLAEEEFTGAFYIGTDVTESFKAAGFEEGLLAALDEALSGHMSTEGFEEGGTVRAITVEETALGAFSRYKRIVAMEYRPADPAGKPTRIYAFNGQEAHGYWDDKGHQPNAGGWRSPVPGAPITSPFNPKRLHPVLHTVMPHTGTDYGAPSGTPIYAAYKGTLVSVGPAGPCGNTVQIQHPGNILTGYCHMSRFANVKAGEKVGTRQLIGYVGTTGRSTGPHLHFFVKKAGQFVDSRTLKIDGDRPVPAVDRSAFLAAKAELDRRLDAIPLPDPPPQKEKPAAAAASASASAEPAEAPPEKVAKGGKEPKEPKDKSGRRASQIGSPDAIAAAKAEPGIHPSQFVESKGEDDDDGPLDTPDPKAAAPEKKGPKGKPDPSEEDDDEK